MKAAVIVFPGSNCDRDLAVGFEGAGAEVQMVWHKDTALPQGLDIVGIPGGFSFGDYLRCGAIAAQSPITRAVIDFVHGGGHALGICNGFQVLTETGLLPGALMRNANLKFICKPVDLKVETTSSVFTQSYKPGQAVRFPIAHHDGNYVAGPELVAELTDQDRIAFSYANNPNGSTADIAGVLSENRRVLGMMPHPERAIETAQGGSDGAALFAGLTALLATA
ncbi:MAG: phosphoribosylformylglycinamidine synthase subunit PurQ [Rhodobacter sp.]|nr:phosphoribosylformylglycinamidine synthase subunit PurQ [Rhodobacter sp.]